MIAETLARLAYDRANKHMAADDLPAAQRWFTASLGFAPYSPLTWLNLGNAMMNDGDTDAALGCYRRAMTLAPHMPDAKVNAAIALLSLGQWREGWELYEHRFALPEFRARNGLKGGDPAKMWDGASLEGKTLLVFNEQGIGDVLQFFRYRSALRIHSPSHRTVWRVPAPLVRLIRASVSGSDTVVSDGEPAPYHDVIAPFLSLPWLTNWTYPLAPGPSYVKTRGERIGARPSSFTVAIVWAGSPHHKNNARRSMSFSTLAPLLSTPGACFTSFQQGERAADAPHYARRYFIDFYETAVALRGTDLLITVDTSIAHLAGALGVPCWIMLPYVADFRWGRTGETTPWYNSVRLFRQTTRGDWSSVIQQVRASLLELIEQRKAA